MIRLVIIFVIAAVAFAIGYGAAMGMAQDACLDAGGSWRASDRVCLGVAI